MRHVRIKALACVVVAGCIAIQARPDESELESEIASEQGSDFQGSDFQGSDFQGTSYQGARWEYTSLDNVTYGASNVVDAAVTGTTLSVWKFRAVLGDFGWDQRFPNKICHWNVDRTVMTTCTTVNLATSPSPIAGTNWQATFLGPDGPFVGTVRIGLSISELGAVHGDPSSAMHVLKSHASSAACTIVPVGQEGCKNPGGCRKNCDLWLYDVRLVDVPDENGEHRRFCPPGHAAYAIAGSYSETGTYSPDDPRRFTFACTSGTIAKCTKWGYRPFGVAAKVNLSGGFTKGTFGLADFHQPCVRAARADYCSSNHTYTKAGTLIDISDDDGNTGYRLIHNTRGGTVPAENATGFVFEASFDRHSAYMIDHVRYQEMLNEYPQYVLADCFNYNYLEGNGVLKRKLEVAAPTTPLIKVESTTACAHTEQTKGRALHPNCSTCTARIDSLNASPWNYFHCTDAASNQGWDDECVARAAAVCNPIVGRYKTMALHGECTVGTGLSTYDSGCTIKVCGQKASCCNAGMGGAWDAECASIANASCFGGQENATVGYCGL